MNNGRIMADKETVGLQLNCNGDDTTLEMWPTDVEAHGLLALLLAPAILKNPGKESLGLRGTIHYPPAHGVTKIVFHRKDVDAVEDDGWPAGSFDEWVEITEQGLAYIAEHSGKIRASVKLELPNELIDALTIRLNGRCGPNDALIAVESIQDSFAAAHKALDDRLARILKAQGEGK